MFKRKRDKASPSSDGALQFYDLEQELGARLREMLAEREKARAGAGERILAQVSGGAAISPVAGPTADDVDGLLAAIDLARERRREALEARYNAAYEAQVAELRGRAQALRREADERQQKTDALLAQLKESEEVDYVPRPPGPEDLSLASPWLSVQTLNIPTARSARQRVEADELETRAAALTPEPVEMAGRLTAEDTADLLRQLQALPVETIGPALHEVRDWFGGAPARGSMVLIWAGGKIDLVRSATTCRPVGRGA